MSEIGTGLQNATGIRNGMARAGYAFVEASDMRNALARFGTLADWPQFAESWNDLEVDTYMADGGRYRRRRFAVYGAGKQGAIVRGAHQPHYQTLDYNTLNGGIERWFKPVTEEIGDGASMRTILEYCRALFGRLAPETARWLDKRTLGSFTLTDPLDAALVDDARCYHGVTPVEPENPAQPAYRDVLVVTFRKKS